MSDRMFLYIDILGFKDLVARGHDLKQLYEIIDELNVHSDNDFTTLVFSDTIVVYGDEFWNANPSQAIMWLAEFAQDLMYRLIVKDIYFRAYITYGDFQHYKLNNVEAYFGKALVECYEREKEIKCTGVFIDSRLAHYSDIFFVTKYDEHSHYVHVLQHLDQVSSPYENYPVSGYYLESTGMEWWVAYLFRYLENIHNHANDNTTDDCVRLKYKNAWNMVASRHAGLLQRLVDASFKPELVIDMDWSEPYARIGTANGAWG